MPIMGYLLCNNPGLNGTFLRITAFLGISAAFYSALSLNRKRALNLYSVNPYVLWAWLFAYLFDHLFGFYLISE